MSIADILTRLAGKISKVFDAGKKAGKDAEWSEFWDVYQENGNRTDYRYAFSVPWTADLFKPKYDIVFGNRDNRFVFIRTNIVDLEKCLNDAGVILDTSQATTLGQLFQYSEKIQTVPIISTISTGSTGVNAMFDGAKKLETIRKLILKDDGTQTLTNTFQACKSLKNIVIEGVIGKDINFGECEVLSAESIESIINALSDTTTGMTCTFFLTQYLSENWDELVARKPNWRFAAV